MTFWQHWFTRKEDGAAGPLAEPLPPVMDATVWERERRELESVKQKIDRAKHQLDEVLEARRRHGHV